MAALHPAESAASRISPSPFDALAPRYDAAFSDSHLGRELRQVVWRCLERLPLEDRSWLDLGCGTGEDTLWLRGRGATVVGVDASEAMLRLATAKARSAGLDGSRLRLASIDLNQPEALLAVCGSRWFDGALADFGVLNCVTDLSRLGAVLAGLLQPDAPLLTVTMGPCCAWELAGGLFAGRPRHAARRWQRRHFATSSGQTALRYPSPATLAREFAPHFLPTGRPLALGLLLPPTDLAAFLRRRPAALRLLGRLEAGIRGLPGAAWASDHYVTRFRRAPTGPTLTGP